MEVHRWQILYKIRVLEDACNGVGSIINKGGGNGGNG